MQTSGRDYVRERMPPIGVGTYQVRSRNHLFGVLDAALANGYRLVDTAQAYRNERHIGAALEQLLPKYGLTRQDIFVISKLDPANHGAQKVAQSIEQTLDNLGVQYLDLFLVHWPAARSKNAGDPLNARLRSESWTVMEKYHASGQLKAIGVSNYTIAHLEQLLEHAAVLPALNQCEFHPHYAQTALIDYCKKHGIVFQAYSSFGSPRAKQNLFSDQQIVEAANQYGCSVPQFLLSWAISQGICVLPRSTNSSHIIENFKSVELKIGHQDIQKVISERAQKYCWDPSVVL